VSAACPVVRSTVSASAGSTYRRRGRRVLAVSLSVVAVFGVVAGCDVPAGSDVVSLAAAKEGLPYVYGATGPYAFDCSGLVQYVFSQTGRTLPRTAQEQYDASTPISADQAGRGDLVFYGSPWGVYHVAIYVGGGQMISADNPGAGIHQEQTWPGAFFGRP